MKDKYAGMAAKDLEDENHRPRQIFADIPLEKIELCRYVPPVLKRQDRSACRGRQSILVPGDNYSIGHLTPADRARYPDTGAGRQY